MVEFEKLYHQKVLLKSFPMNGHVSSFDNLTLVGNFCVNLPLLTEYNSQLELKPGVKGPCQEHHWPWTSKLPSEMHGLQEGVLK
jgi:hypothetical protein